MDPGESSTARNLSRDYSVDSAASYEGTASNPGTGVDKHGAELEGDQELGVIGRFDPGIDQDEFNALELPPDSGEKHGRSSSDHQLRVSGSGSEDFGSRDLRQESNARSVPMTETKKPYLETDFDDDDVFNDDDNDETVAQASEDEELAGINEEQPEIELKEPQELQIVLDQFAPHSKGVLAREEEQLLKVVQREEAAFENKFRDNFEPDPEMPETVSIESQPEPEELTEMELDQVVFPGRFISLEKMNYFEATERFLSPEDNFEADWTNMASLDIDEELGIPEPEQPAELEIVPEEIFLRHCEIFIEKEIPAKKILKKRISSESNRSSVSETEPKPSEDETFSAGNPKDSFERVNLEATPTDADADADTDAEKKSTFDEFLMLQKMNQLKKKKTKRKLPFATGSKKVKENPDQGLEDIPELSRSSSAGNSKYPGLKSSSETNLRNIPDQDSGEVDQTKVAKKKSKSIFSRGKKFFSSDKKSKNLKTDANVDADVDVDTDDDVTKDQRKKSKNFNLLSIKPHSSSLPNISSLEPRASVTSSTASTATAAKPKKSKSLSKSLKKSLKSLTSKTSTYVVNPEHKKVDIAARGSGAISGSGPVGSSGKYKTTNNSSGQDGNIRLKIGNSSFFLPAESSPFRPSFSGIPDSTKETDAPPIPPVRKKRLAKLAEMQKEKEALETIEHIPAVRKFSSPDEVVPGTGTGTPEQDEKDESDGSGHTLVESPKRGQPDQVQTSLMGTKL